MPDNNEIVNMIVEKTDAAEATETTTETKMSKRQLKRIIKSQKWLERKSAKR